MIPDARNVVIWRCRQGNFPYLQVGILPIPSCGVPYSEICRVGSYQNRDILLGRKSYPKVFDRLDFLMELRHALDAVKVSAEAARVGGPGAPTIQDARRLAHPPITTRCFMESDIGYNHTQSHL